jgi:hypothetical protein
MTYQLLKGEKLRNEGRGRPAANERFGTMAGVLRWIVLQNSKLSVSWQVQVARHCAKPPLRYKQ